MSPEARTTLPDDDREITITRIVEAPPGAVFQAWLEPGHLSRWWGPRSGRTDWSTPHVETNPRLGGAYRICIRSPRGDDHWSQGIYEAVDAPHRLVFTHAWDSERGHVGEEPRVSVEFAEIDAGSRVRFRKSGFASRASRDGEIEGWHECLDRLVRYFGNERAGGREEDEAEIQALGVAWSKALEAKDVDALTACLPCLPTHFESERRELQLTAAGDVAFAHFLHRVRPIGETRRAADTWLRATVCYQKIDGRWRVAHEHVSLPFDSQTGQVVFITDEDAETSAC